MESSRGRAVRGRQRRAALSHAQIAAIGFKKSCPSKHRAIAERRIDAEQRQAAAIAELAALDRQRQQRFTFATQQAQARERITSKTPEQVAREFLLDGGLLRYQQGRLLLPTWRIQDRLVHDLVQREASGLDSVLCAFMGLGKTLVGLELIRQTSLQRGRGRFGHPTLIVGPKGVYHQWMEEVRKFYPTELMTFDSVESSDDAFTRFSAERAMQCLDFVVVSYDTLKAAVGSPLFDVNWHRIIVDEGTFIVNEVTQVFKACAKIKVQRRLFISGTPVPNARADEMNAILRFLGSDLRVPSLIPLARAMMTVEEPVADDTLWLIQDDDEEEVMEEGDVSSAQHISSEDILAKWRYALQRYWVAAHADPADPTAMPAAVQKLQLHETETVWVTLSPAERSAYNETLRQANLPSERRHRLRWITRLRQMCNSVTLTSRTEVKKRVAAARRTIRDSERAAIKGTDEVAKEAAQRAQKLRRVRKKAGLAEWGTDIVSTDGSDSADEEEDAEDVDDETTTIAAAELPSPVLSSKYRAMIQYEHARMKPGEKALAISETLGPLEEFQHIARAHGITSEILSGDMKTRQRAEVTARVGDPTSPDPRFVMLPIRLGFGINGLQGDAERGGGANHVLFIDGYWNEALEIQGLARLLRPGQQRDVYSVKFVTLGTIEELVLRHNQFKKMLHRLVIDANSHRAVDDSTSKTST